MSVPVCRVFFIICFYVAFHLTLVAMCLLLMIKVVLVVAPHLFQVE